MKRKPEARSPDLEEAAKWYTKYHALAPDDLLGLKKLVEVCEELEKLGQGEGEMGRQGEGMESCRRVAEQIARTEAESPAAVLREELERRTDDWRIVAELLGVPLDAVELGANLVENGGFEVWKGGRPEGWAWSNMADGKTWNLALFVGGFDEFDAYSGQRAMRVDGFWIQRKLELEPARAGYLRGEIELKPDTPYVLSFYYRIRNLREEKAAIWVSGTPEVLFKHDRMLPSTDGGWRKFIIVGWNRKEEAKKVKPLLRSWGVGEAEFDGMELREIALAANVQIKDFSTRFELR